MKGQEKESAITEIDGKEYTVTKMIHDNGTTIVYRPVLTDEERERRMNKFKEATARFLIAVERELAEKAEKEQAERRAANE